MPKRCPVVGAVGRAGHRRPGGAGVVIEVHGSLIAGEDLGINAIGLGGDHRVVLAPPALGRHRMAPDAAGAVG